MWIWSLATLTNHSRYDSAFKMSEATASSENTATGCFWMVFLILLAVGWCGYLFLDSFGWVSHEVDSAISAESNWFVGESKECSTFTLDKTGFALANVNCDNGPMHSVKIKFFGRKEQPEYASIQWKCTREAEGFTCFEQSGVKASAH
jgi:hypothetical protein